MKHFKDKKLNDKQIAAMRILLEADSLAFMTMSRNKEDEGRRFRVFIAERTEAHGKAVRDVTSQVCAVFEVSKTSGGNLAWVGSYETVVECLNERAAFYYQFVDALKNRIGQFIDASIPVTPKLFIGYKL